MGATELHLATGACTASAVRTYTANGQPVAERSTVAGVSGSTLMTAEKFPWGVGNKSYEIEAWVGDYPAFGDGGEVEFFSLNKPITEVTPNSKWNAVYGASVTPSMTESVSIGGSTIASAAPNDQQPWVTSWSPREQDMNLNDLQYTATVTFRNHSMYAAFEETYIGSPFWSFPSQGTTATLNFH